MGKTRRELDEEVRKQIEVFEREGLSVEAIKVAFEKLVKVDSSSDEYDFILESIEISFDALQGEIVAKRLAHMKKTITTEEVEKRIRIFEDGVEKLKSYPQFDTKRIVFLLNRYRKSKSDDERYEIFEMVSREFRKQRKKFKE